MFAIRWQMNWKRLPRHAGNDPDSLVRAYVDIIPIFGHDLRNEPVFVQAVTQALTRLNNGQV